MSRSRGLASVSGVNIEELEGRTYGPASWTVNSDAVADFVELTGGKQSEFAPPGFAAAALFAVAPELLRELYEMSVIHGEQTFSWFGPLEMGQTYTVVGEVTRVRERAGVNFVTFEVVIEGVLAAKALFLVSGAEPAARATTEMAEPNAGDQGSSSEGQRSASRADLVRYAAATRDWNPVHWDHDSAVDAGFPGVVVHGLLQAGWALAEVSDESVASVRIRFRSPLRPANPVTVVRDGNTVTISDVDTEYLTATITPA